MRSRDSYKMNTRHRCLGFICCRRHLVRLRGCQIARCSQTLQPEKRARGLEQAKRERKTYLLLATWLASLASPDRLFSSWRAGPKHIFFTPVSLREMRVPHATKRCQRWRRYWWFGGWKNLSAIGLNGAGYAQDISPVHRRHRAQRGN